MTCPPAARNAGSSGRVSATAPMTLTSKALRHSSTVVSATRPGYNTPALWISTSSSTIGSTTAGIASISSKSTGQVVAPNRSASSSSRSEGRPARNSVWVGASAVAMADPSPPAAPVIIAVGMAVTLSTCAGCPPVA